MTSTCRWRAAALLTVALLLPACDDSQDEVTADEQPSSQVSISATDADEGRSSSSTDEPSVSGTSSPDGGRDAGTPAPEEPGGDQEGAGSASDEGNGTTAATLDENVFSGYEDVSPGVAPWLPTCPRDFGPEPAGVVPSAATAMGTASRTLEGGSARTARQVAVFGSPQEAVRAADELLDYARSCAGEYEPLPDFVASTQTVAPVGVGAQGTAVDVQREDGASHTVFFRRGNAVGLVVAEGLPGYVEGRMTRGDAVAGARALFRQMCTYERGAC